MQIIKKIQSGFDSPEDVLLFVRICSLVTVLPLLVKFLSIPRLMKIITPARQVSAIKCDNDGTRDKIEKYTDYILGRNYWMFKQTCLKRSLILYYFLRKYGMNVSICFGVKYKKEISGSMKEKQMDGHAWLLYRGDIYLEKNIQIAKTYTLTYCYPGIKDHGKEQVFMNGLEGLR